MSAISAILRNTQSKSNEYDSVNESNWSWRIRNHVPERPDFLVCVPDRLDGNRNCHACLPWSLDSWEWSKTSDRTKWPKRKSHSNCHLVIVEPSRWHLAVSAYRQWKWLDGSSKRSVKDLFLNRQSWEEKRNLLQRNNFQIKWTNRYHAQETSTYLQ